MQNTFIVSHPLVKHKLTILRDKRTGAGQFRVLVKEIALLLGYEVTRDLAMTTREIETPLKKMRAPTLVNENIVLVSIMRAGNGLLDGALELIPSGRVGFIGLYRDPQTLKPVEYYSKLPPNLEDNDVIIFDPMLATGHSAIAAVSKVKEYNPRSIKLVNLLAAPEGIEALTQTHPDVRIFVAAVDEGLNEHGYIEPGLGDAGDKINFSCANFLLCESSIE
jgi:uracil phosphoribosyltransferase